MNELKSEKHNDQELSLNNFLVLWNTFLLRSSTQVKLSSDAIGAVPFSSETINLKYDFANLT